MPADVRQHIAQVGFRLDAVELCRADERIEHRCALAAGIGAGEQPVLAPDGDRTDGILGGGVGDLQPPVIDVAGKCLPSRAAIADGRRQLAAPGDELQPRIEPGSQGIELRARLGLTHAAPVLGRLAGNSTLDGEQGTDPLQRLSGDRRAGGLVHVEELASDMRPAGDLGHGRGLVATALACAQAISRAARRSAAVASASAIMRFTLKAACPEVRCLHAPFDGHGNMTKVTCACHAFAYLSQAIVASSSPTRLTG